MYRLRCSFALNKFSSSLPLFRRQFRILPYFKELREWSVEKGKLISDHKEKMKKLELVKDHEIAEMRRDHENELRRIKFIYELDKERLQKQIVDKRLEHEIADGRLAKEIARLEKEFEKEKADRRLEHEIADGRLAKEITRLEKEFEKEKADRRLEKMKTGHLNMNYLRLKGAVHIRGVFEQWELFSLSSYEGNRGKKWLKYLEDNKETLEIFQNFYPNPDKIDINRVVAEMKNFYKWLSERIHNAHATGDHVEWRRNLLTPVQNKVTEYMCQELSLSYRIIDTDEVEPSEIITDEVTSNKD
ncbi:hypothetical protein RclHR1_00420003 [Rhizophagus clarus]|uniref:Uncharacterized protein n=1 Tax=Rhizophagus clarus TaxID=94130 RepID=A0A2Z6RHH0_9GLOM|nr:hypothetical protein RclHR1_00420003 [Rhizophagus clarus]